MAKRQDITEYTLGEAIGIGVFLRDRSGNAIDPDTVTTTFIVSELHTGRKLVTVAGASVITVNNATGECTVPIPVAQQRNLVANTEYRYDLWSDAGSQPLHQAHGQFRLQPAVQP
jgi:hypothetical protein